MIAPKRRLRVVHVVQALEVGGLEKQVIALAQRADRGWVELEIVCTDAAGSQACLCPADTPVTALEAKPGLDWRAVLRLARHLRQRRADIVHSHNQRPHYLSTLAACLARVPVLINTRHGPSADASLRSRLNRRAMAALSQVIVAVSADTGDIAVRLDGIARRKLRIILNGTDLAAARFARGEARQRLDLCQGAFVIGAVGRLVPVKDHASFIAAFDRVRSQIPGVAAAILGDGPLAAELSAAARARGCDSLRFHGHRADAVALLPAFDLFVQPSLSEGISLSVIEAMAAGVPVIATSIGGNREAVGDSEAGVLVPPADVGALASAIVALACDPQARARLADAGRRRVEMRFSVDAMARAYDTLYLEEARQRGLDV